MQFGASFCYRGEPVFLEPAHMMRKTESLYQYDFPDGLVVFYEATKIPSQDPEGEEACLALLRFENQGRENTGQIFQAKTMDITLRRKEGSSVLFHGLQGDSCGGASFLPLDFPLPKRYHMEPVGGRSSNTSAFPFFDLACGEKSWLFAVGWTGQWCGDLEVQEDCIRIRIGMCDSDFYLEPGEAVRLPAVFVLEGGRPDALRRTFRKMAREHLSPAGRLEKVALPLAIQCFDRYFQGLGGSKKEETWATQPGQLRVLERAGKCEYLDALWMDAAWFTEGFPHGVGNYTYDGGFPEGLGPVADAAHRKGMGFVLWFEPERVCRGTQVWREHPEMLLGFPWDGDTFLFDLSDGEARGWLLEKLSAMLAENHVDVYRQDFNMDPLPYWRHADREGRKGITEMKYVEGLYWLWDSLVQRFPGLLIDDCASGGRRIDLETMRRAVYLWRSDTGCYPDTGDMRPSVWSENQILALSEYLPYHACAVWEPDAFTLRSAATQGLACNFDLLSPDFDFVLARKALGEVAGLRQFWEEGSFYPLTVPTVREDVWAAWQLAGDGRGCAVFFRRGQCPWEEQRFCLRELDPMARYQVCLRDEDLQETYLELEGREFLAGIKIRIPRSRASVVLTYLRRQERE